MSKNYSTEAVLLARVDDSGGRYACWPWTGYTVGNGYGLFYVARKHYLAHRATYEAPFGAIPDGLIVRHSCDNPRCCNPFHLSVGTKSDNAVDREVRGRGYKRPRKYGPKKPDGRRKLTADQTRDIVEKLSAGESRRAVAEAFGVTYQRVAQIHKEGIQA